jgi:hypothetical protein
MGTSESKLLARLGEGLPDAFWDRWHALKPEDQAQREEMIPVLERWHLTCMECVLALAKLRNEDPHTTARCLGLCAGLHGIPSPFL